MPCAQVRDDAIAMMAMSAMENVAVPWCLARWVNVEFPGW
jgi:hypothetical protein